MLRRNFISSILTALPFTRALGGTASPEPVKTITRTKGNEPTQSGIKYRPYHFEEWLSKPQQPIFSLDEIPEPDHDIGIIALEAIRSGLPITFDYRSPYTGNTRRTVTPVMIFRKINNPYILEDVPYPFDPDAQGLPPAYLLAHCHLRKQTRTFRLDRIRGSIEMKPSH